jgi:transposase
MAIVAEASSDRQTARRRAEVIMKVRCGLMSASQAAEQLGVSRKTYYKWEERGLSALLTSLEDQSGGRPCQPVDSEKENLERQLAEVRRENAVWQHKMELKDLLSESKLRPGTDRAEKK